VIVGQEVSLALSSGQEARFQSRTGKLDRVSTRIALSNDEAFGLLAL
jgi:hypothetical protein